MTPYDRPGECPLEEPVAAALATASLRGGLLSHAQSCVICSETVSIWSCLHTLAVLEAESPLPSPHLIWWKAQLTEQRRLAERSLTVIQFFRKVAIAAAAIILSLCASLFAPRLPLALPVMYLWAVLSLVGLSLITAAWFLYSDRHPTRR